MSYIILQDLLGARFFRWFDSKGRDVDRSKIFSQGGEVYSKGGEMTKWTKSTYEEEAAK